MDGNRRPNYDGCLLPPVFIGPGDPYSKPQGHNLAAFFGGSRSGGMRVGKPAKPLREWYHSGRGAGGSGAGSGADADAGAKSRSGFGPGRTGPGMRAGKARNTHGLFSFTPMDGPGGPGDTSGSKASAPPRGKFKGDWRGNLGRGTGGVFSAPKYEMQGYEDPRDSGRGKGGGVPWRPSDTYGAEFDRNPARHVPQPDKKGKTYDLADYKPPSTAPGRQRFTDKNRNLQRTFDRFPGHIADPYTGDHIQYTKHGYYKGKRRLGLVTYKNVTRTAAQGKSFPH